MKVISVLSSVLVTALLVACSSGTIDAGSESSNVTSGGVRLPVKCTGTVDALTRIEARFINGFAGPLVSLTEIHVGIAGDVRKSLADVNCRQSGGKFNCRNEKSPDHGFGATLSAATAYAPLSGTAFKVTIAGETPLAPSFTCAAEGGPPPGAVGLPFPRQDAGSSGPPPGAVGLPLPPKDAGVAPSVPLVFSRDDRPVDGAFKQFTLKPLSGGKWNASLETKAIDRIAGKEIDKTDSIGIGMSCILEDQIDCKVDHRPVDGALTEVQLVEADDHTWTVTVHTAAFDRIKGTNVEDSKEIATGLKRQP